MKNKLNKIIYRPSFFIFLWLIFISSPFFSFFRIRFLTEVGRGLIIVRGLSSFIYYFPVVISFVDLVFLILWLKDFFNKKLSWEKQKTLVGLSLISLIFLITSSLLINSEYGSFPNYLYSNYGFTVAQLELMSFVAAFQILSSVFFLAYHYNLSARGKQGVGTKLISSLNIGAFYLSVVGFFCLILLSASTFSRLPFIIKEEKMGYESKFGVQYKYLELLAQHVPNDATVLLPPQDEKWPAIGNQPVVRYFLYPRDLVSGLLLNNQKLADGVKEAYFVEITPDIESTHWPTINLSTNQIIFDEKSIVSYRNIDLIFKSDEGKVFKIIF